MAKEKLPNRELSLEKEGSCILPSPLTRYEYILTQCVCGVFR
ncbi:hypothetical protein IKC_05737 [Bacillus cereus VD184]|uniref:Uncharacterized protein n=1 Tax=Bacillus cereus VD184 TaxID=1053242 RepID=A0A9W5VS69_BACCE|nr:hypothetical protein IKC_05737 [Bacillus cereus VD184]